MDRAKQIFEVARDRGDKYILIMQKKQQDAENLTFALKGSWGAVQMRRLDFKDYAYVHVLNTSTPWEEHEEYLRVLDFKW